MKSEVRAFYYIVIIQTLFTLKWPVQVEELYSSVKSAIENMFETGKESVIGWSSQVLEKVLHFYIRKLDHSQDDDMPIFFMILKARHKG